MPKAANAEDLISRAVIAEQIVRIMSPYVMQGLYGEPTIVGSALADAHLSEDHDRITRNEPNQAFEQLSDGTFCWLPFSWTELELLRECVQDQIAERKDLDDRWGQLNALRTALTEAQYGLRRVS